MNCVNHPENEAIGICVKCGKPMCRECLVDVGGKYHCKECLKNTKNIEVGHVVINNSNSINGSNAKNDNDTVGAVVCCVIIIIIVIVSMMTH